MQEPGLATSANEVPGVRRLSSRAALVVVSVLLAVFAGRAWQGADRESLTFDEPAHLLSGFAAMRLHDFRLNSEHPPLWKLWAALPSWFSSFHLDTASSDWRDLPGDRRQQENFIEHAFFQSPGNATESLVSRARFMMLAIGVALGGLIGLWAWQLGGSVGAVAAVLLYSMDPNFLAHAPLVTNDVAMSLAFLAVMYCTWSLRIGWTARRAALLACSLAAATLVKYSALALWPVVALLLLGSASLPSKQKWSQRFGQSLVVLLCCVAVSLLAIWACYGFRFGIAPDPSVHPDLGISLTWEVEHGPPSPGIPASRDQAQRASLATKVLLTLDRHHVLPEAYLDGLLYTHARAQSRASYLLGHSSGLGHWYYFPVAVLVKTPLATLTAGLLALLVLASGYARPLSRQLDRQRIWTTVCLTLPPTLFFAAAMQAHLNIGLRHVLPVYPFLFVGTGVAAARLLQSTGRRAALVVALMASGLVAESVFATPDYLPYFNFAAGGSRGGFRVLGDSNLDWGQGLKLLAAWERRNPQASVQLAYFGTAAPEYYGVHARNALDPITGQIKLASRQGVVAVSATILQAMQFDPAVEPLFVLGGSIYLFRTSDFVRGLHEAGA